MNTLTQILFGLLFFSSMFVAVVLFYDGKLQGFAYLIVCVLLIVIARNTIDKNLKE